MKKDKARKGAIKKALIRQIKNLIFPVIVLVLVLAGVLVIRFYKEGEEKEEYIQVHSNQEKAKSLVLENDSLKFELDTSTTQFSLTVKDTGAVWYSNPQDISEDPLIKNLKLEQEKLNSTLLLTYSTLNGVDTLFNNYAYSMKKGTFDLEQDGDSIKVLYTIGDTEKEYIIPNVCTETRFQELLDAMDKGTASRVTEYYKKYDINNLGKKDNKDELLEKYPILETDVIYVLRDSTKDNLKVKLEGYFADAGYTYEEYMESQSAGGSESSSKHIFNINMIYRLEGDQLVVEIPFDEIEYKSAYPIYYLSVLPYFGAGGTEDEGYLMVPEGGGGLIYFNNGKVAQNSYFANIYGWDYAQSRDAVVHETDVYFNAYGIAKNGNSFLCILEDGASYAGIAADISGKKNSYNFAYPQYNLIHREQYEMGDRASGAIYVYQQELPEHEKIEMRYCFTGSDDYSDLAAVYRDYLEEKNPGSMTLNDETEAPVAIEIVGAIDKIRQILGVPVSRPLELTTFEEAKNILADLLSENIQNISVKMTGWMNGGVQQKILNRISLVSSLGSKKDLTELSEYAAEKGIDFYLDGITNYAYDSGILEGFIPILHAARFLNRDQAKLYPYSTVTFAQIDDREPHYLLDGQISLNMIDKLNEGVERYNANISFQEVGYQLNSDYNRNDVVTRESVLAAQVEKLEQIDESGKKIMVNMGNNYVLPYTDFITNMDLSGSVYTIIDQAVPIYQMAIHGAVNYAGESLNLTQNQEQILLESAEYGAALAFTLMDESAFTLQNTFYTEYFGADYSSWKDRLVSIYSRYNEELGHTFNQHMVGHEKLSNTLSCTSYEDGTRVYVNYGYDTVSVDGGKVGARDYLVVTDNTKKE